jgi:ArsR family transcriptional regulator, arsenate/arsenite/antimonite-responsive transcriptional repressor
MTNRRIVERGPDRSLRATLRVTKALADAQRLRILMLLRAGELCVCQITEVLALAPSTVSKHLSILAAADLLRCRKDGRWAYYRLPAGTAAKAVRPVLTWLNAALRNDESIRRDAKKLRTVIACDPGTLSKQQRP